MSARRRRWSRYRPARGAAQHARGRTPATSPLKEFMSNRTCERSFVWAFCFCHVSFCHVSSAFLSLWRLVCLFEFVAPACEDCLQVIIVGKKSSSPFDQPPRAGSARPASQFAARCCPPGSSSGLCPAGTPPPRWMPRGRLSGMRTRCVTRAFRSGSRCSAPRGFHPRSLRAVRASQPPLKRDPPPSPLTSAGLRAGQLFPPGDVRAPRHGRPLLHPGA